MGGKPLEKLLPDKKELVRFAIVALSAAGFLIIFSPLFVPIVLAVIFAFGYAEIFALLQSRFDKKHVRLVLFGTGAVLTGFFLVLTVVSFSRFYNLTVGSERSKTIALWKFVLDQINILIDKLTSNLATSTIGEAAREQIKNQLLNTGRNSINKIFSMIADFFSSMPEATVNLFVLAVSFLILIKHRHVIYTALRNSRWFHASDLYEVTLMARQVSYTVIISNLIVGLVQALIITLGALIAGLNEWSVIFFISFVSSFLPVIGTGPVTLGLALFCFFTNNPSGGVWMLVVAILSGTIDNFLRPYLVARSERNVNSMVSLIGTIGAIIIFGFAGLFIGPFLVSFMSRIWPYTMKQETRRNHLRSRPRSEVIEH